LDKEYIVKSDLGIKAIALFIISILFLVALAFFESSLAGLSVTAERFMSVLLLVVPAFVGVILGVMSLNRKESRPWLALLGIVCNALFGLFHLAVVFFAG
jgi:phosphoglycerol transferase MdoB-like AlkP superfamily enzyme